MAKIKHRRREVVGDKIPLVSVIIPMYNAAKFIPQTLESLAYQTMQDFEVVVVDDCSTDTGVEVVEGFKPRFDSQGVKLHVVKLPKNSGTPGLPRNVGIQMACGKYIAFLDSDDLFTKTALEELTALAEEYQADMLHADVWFKVWGDKGKSVDDPAFTDMNELTNPKNFMLKSFRRRPPAQKPELEEFDIAERMRRWVNWEYYFATCTSFYRRDFIIANQIRFSDSPSSEDHFFKFNCVCLANKIVRLAKPFYIVRPRANSVSHTQLDAEKILHKWIRVFSIGLNELERIMSGVKFFGEHPDYRYAVLDFFINLTLEYPECSVPVYAQIHPGALYPLIKKDFSSDAESLSAYLFGTMNIQRLQIMRLQQELAKFHKQ